MSPKISNLWPTLYTLEMFVKVVIIHGDLLNVIQN